MSISLKLNPKLNGDDLEELNDIFEKYDPEQSGFIRICDIYEILIKFGLQPTEAEFFDWMRKTRPSLSLDPMSFKEFCHIFGSLIKPVINDENLAMAFKIFDQNQDGAISAHELKSTANSSGMELTLKEAAAMLQECNTDEGRFTLAKFMDLIYPYRMYD